MQWHGVDHAGCGSERGLQAGKLEQFAVMGEIYFRSIFGTRRPRVGLLSIGEEESKGNELTAGFVPAFEAASAEFCG